jgi:hypothetical protein
MMKNITDKRDATNMCLKLNKNVFIFLTKMRNYNPTILKFKLNYDFITLIGRGKNE